MSAMSRGRRSSSLTGRLAAALIVALVGACGHDDGSPVATIGATTSVAVTTAQPLTVAVTVHGGRSHVLPPDYDSATVQIVTIGTPQFPRAR